VPHDCDDLLLLVVRERPRDDRRDVEVAPAPLVTAERPGSTRIDSDKRAAELALQRSRE
jgi:hypothetical protein